MKETRKKKPYVPTLRSGPYAILLALSTLSENQTAGMTKVQLIQEAQDHCDASFTAPSDPSKFYTAWDSMKTLQAKDLVHDWGRPTKRYALTEEGWEIARGIQSGIKSMGTHQMHQDESGAESHLKIQDTSTPDTSKAANGSEAQGSTRIQSPAPSFKFPSFRKDNFKRRTSTKTIPSSVSKFNEIIDIEHSEESGQDGSLEIRPTLSQYQRNVKPAEDFEFMRLPSSPQDSSLKVKSLPLTSPELAPPAISTLADPMASASQVPSIQSIVIPAGSFTVELILDNREVRSKLDRDYIQDGLAARGATPITRALELGDAMWIAKVNDPRVLAEHGEDPEIALDWIVERKRLDDLISSIKDGRYREQKHRMNRSGMRNVIYIIEHIDLGSETAQRTSEMIETAIAATQVHNGYFVKRTWKLDHTIRYLARMTLLLKHIYEVRPLSFGSS